jgi:hypothetical protein
MRIQRPESMLDFAKAPPERPVYIQKAPRKLPMQARGSERTPGTTAHPTTALLLHE